MELPINNYQHLLKVLNFYDKRLSISHLGHLYQEIKNKQTTLILSGGNIQRTTYKIIVILRRINKNKDIEYLMVQNELDDISASYEFPSRMMTSNETVDHAVDTILDRELGISDHLSYESYSIIEFSKIECYRCLINKCIVNIALINIDVNDYPHLIKDEFNYDKYYHIIDPELSTHWRWFLLPSFYDSLPQGLKYILDD